MKYKSITMPEFCTLDNSVSLEAKGLYSLIMGFVNQENHSLNELYKMCNEDKSYVDSLIIELIDKGYLYLATLSNNDSKDVFHIFELNNKNDWR